MLASDVLTKVRDLIKDPLAVRWTNETLWGWVGDGMRAVADIHPGVASTQNTAYELGTNETLQDVPAECVRLLDVRRNMGSDGTTYGKPIREVDWESLRAFETTWHSGTGEAAVDNFAYRPEIDRFTFQVAPRTHATTAVCVDIIYVTRLDDPTTVSEVLPIDSEYEAALVDYVTSRALGADDDLGDEQKSQKHAAAFAAYMSIGAQQDA